MRINEIYHLKRYGYVKGIYDDWTGNTVPDADIRSFDPEAVRAIRATYISEHPENRDEISAMDDTTFLSHIGVLKRGKVTIASMILLGKMSERLARQCRT